MNVIDASIEDLQNEEVEKTIASAEQMGIGKNLPKKTEEFLSYFQLIDYNFIKNAAMVLFGKSPTRFTPQCRIRITVMPFDKTGSSYSDVFVIEENLFKAFDQTLKYFKNNLPLINEFKDGNWTRIVREKFPIDALDEAIVNAMVHRDYSDISGEITINIYPEKIEIINSGEIPANIISGKNTIKPHHSIFRNPTIAHLFHLRGKMEKQGRGLSLIKNRIDEYGLKLPEWRCENGYTTLTIFSIEDKPNINIRMIEFLENQKKGVAFTREDYEQFFVDEKKISEKTARNDIAVLIKAGLLNKVGKGQATRYLRTNKELPDIAG